MIIQVHDNTLNIMLETPFEDNNDGEILEPSVLPHGFTRMAHDLIKY